MDLFEKLDERERGQLSALPIYIALLIAGADGTVDNSEIKQAISFSRLTTSTADHAINAFYNDVYQDFEDKLKVVAANMPQCKVEREKLLIDQIRDVNVILKKIEKPRAFALYESFRRLAKKIAIASGGIFGLGSISKEESELLELNMLENPSV